MAFQDNLSISRQKLEYYYSIAILIIIPALIVLLTFMMISPTRDGFDRLRGIDADRANDIVSAGSLQLREQSDDLQTFVEDITREQESISSLLVAFRDDSGKYVIAAASDTTVVDDVILSQDIASAEANNRAVRFDSTSEDGIAYTQVTSPIRDGDDIIGVTQTVVTQEVSQSVVNDILSRSLFVMLGVVTFIVLLLLNHFKFVEYASLFKKLKEVDQMKNDFLSVATHELKAPMAVIKGSLENVMDGVAGTVDDKARESIQLAFNETDRLTTLVADLLNVSRIEQGQITYNPEAVDPSEVIERITKMYKQKASDKGLEITYEQPNENYIITVDRGRFLEIMTNLIDNAVKYSRQGSVTITHKVEDDMFKTTVRDTGVGMSAKEREHLFQRFYRVRNKKTADIGGTGLGLGIIKQYIEAQDGHIYVDSLEDVGSEFTVEFPLTKTKQTDTEPQEN